MYEKLFTPGKIGNVEIKNRLVMSPMGAGIANMDGTPSEEMIKFYEERAIGGCGLIYAEVTRVDEDNGGVTLLNQLSLANDSTIKAMSRLVATIHKYGTKIFAQLHHPGRQTYSALNGNKPVVAPSAIPCSLCQQETRALEISEIKDLVQKFVNAAVRAKKAGFDGVELHSAHGYLINQFMSPYSNKRTDEYGGSFENRMRFVTEIIKGIRKACGEDYPITARIGGDEMLSVVGITEEYLDLNACVEIAKYLEKIGLNAVNVTCATYDNPFMAVDPIAHPQGWRSYMMKAMKEALSIPVIGVNAVKEPSFAEKMLEDGILDFVSLGRAWIADPHWGIKALEGRENEIRKCIGCVHCFETLLGRPGIAPDCSVNPRAYKELRFEDPLFDTEHHKLVIIGGGPAGMCGALTAALRGMNVTLIEKENRLGGLVNYAAGSPVKTRMRAIAEWYEYMLPKAGVEIMLGTEATVELVKSLEPDAILVATGAYPLIPSTIPGVDKSNVFGFKDVLSGASKLENKNVAIVGAGITGLECAEYLNSTGCKTTLIDVTPVPAPNDYALVVGDDCLRLMAGGTQLLMSHKLEEIRDGSIVLSSVDTGEKKEIECDAVVLSLGITSDTSMVDVLKANFENIHVVGGANDVNGKISGATNGAFQCVRSLFLD